MYIYVCQLPVQYTVTRVITDSTLCRESAALATSLPVEAQDDSKLLCGPECMSTIDQIKMVNLPSGLQYKEIKEGTGPIPPVGFQVSQLSCSTDCNTPLGLGDHMLMHSCTNPLLIAQLHRCKQMPDPS